MPLVERYNDWNIADGSFDDPHMLYFDHRIEADAARSGTGLADVEDNVKATCVITILKPEFGWTQVGKDWCFDPTHKETDLKSIWRSHLPDCVQYDKNCLIDCFCNAATNPTTAYVGPEANILHDKLNHLEWPRDTTDFVSRYEPAGQYIIGPKFCSAYHLGEGFVGTAGHCLDKVLVDGQLGELRVVFDWVDDVVGKKIFPESAIFGIEKVVLCDTHGPAPSPADPVATTAWSRRWDTAIFKLIGGNRAQISSLKSAKHAMRPPCFGSPVYNIGCPLGTQLKVSANAHVLRHALVNDDTNPFSHKIAGYGTFSTDIDQFEGCSGGPVFDANTGYIVGHTSSTQDAVAENDADAIESWAEEYAKGSKNYAVAADINRILEKQVPSNKLYSVHPKFLRTLSGKPRDSALIKCATTLCPGDLAPNRLMQVPGKYQAVFSRHQFDSSDVYLKNATARVDRSTVFMTPLDGLLSDYDTCILTVHFAGATGVFHKPDTSSTLIVASSATEWNIQHVDFHKDTGLSIPSGTDMWSVNLDLATRRHEIPVALLNGSRGFIDWTKIRLDQSLRNPPLMAGINLSIRRPNFPFPVSKIWPPDKPDVTDNPADIGLEWPEEIFEFATTAGKTTGVLQMGDCSEAATESSHRSGRWIWEATLDRVWTNPRQPSQGLRDPLMDDVDELLE